MNTARRRFLQTAAGAATMCTPFFFPICGLPENVKTLLANGADALIKKDGGWTALIYAETDHHWRVEGRREVAKVLKEHIAKKR